MRLPGIGSHHAANAQTDEWYTPRHVLDALGPFDLDPCTGPDNWTRAARFYTADDDGIDAAWEGRVWLNPPYSDVGRWMARMADHGHGTALVFARTETAWWFSSVWPCASALMFLRGRLTFHYPDGSLPNANSGAPSALIAYGDHDADRLIRSGLAGALVSRARVQ